MPGETFTYETLKLPAHGRKMTAMATFLTARGVSWHVESIVSSARERLFLVSPSVRLSGTLLQSIQTVGKTVPISIVYRDDALTAELAGHVRHIGKLTLLRNPNLHAKCYFNEHTMVLASMDLSGDTGASNWEMGILIDREMDAAVYESAFAEVVKITGLSDIVRLQDR
jgi:hypothetical protein